MKSCVKNQFYSNYLLPLKNWLDPCLIKVPESIKSQAGILQFIHIMSPAKKSWSEREKWSFCFRSQCKDSAQTKS